jgi:hypothetical protein
MNSAIFGFFKKVTLKQVVGFTAASGFTSTYFFFRHMHEKRFLERMNNLLTEEKKLSGIYLQQRQPFGFLGFVSWLLPYHQSLKIKMPDGSMVHMGLATDKAGHSRRDVKFIEHNGSNYTKLNNYEISIPIECWVDYERKFGNFPENIDKEILLQKIYEFKGKFGSVGFDLNGDFRFLSCRSAVRDVIRQTELEMKILKN